MRRRGLLRRTALATAGIGTLSGCTDLLGGGDGGDATEDLASYDRFVSEDSFEEGELRAVSLAGPGLAAQSPDIDLPEGEEDDDEELDLADPLPDLATGGVAGALLATGFPSDVGLADRLDDADRLHGVQSIVLEGSFERAAVASDLEDSGLTSSADYGPFRRFTHPADGYEVGFDDAVIAIANEITSERHSPGTAVESTLDAAAGDASDLGEGHDPYTDLAGALEERSFMDVLYSPDGGLFEPEEPDPTEISLMAGPEQIDLAGDAYGYALSMPITLGMERPTIHLAIRYADADAVDPTAEILAAVAPNGEDRSIEVDGSIVRLAAAYPTAAL